MRARLVQVPGTLRGLWLPLACGLALGCSNAAGPAKSAATGSTGGQGAKQAASEASSEPRVRSRSTEQTSPMAADEAGDAWDRPWLGIELKDVDSGAGVLIVSVIPDSPAAKAGIKGGDRLLSAGGQPLSSAQAVIDYVAARRVGQDLGIVFVRGQKQHLARVALEPLPSSEDLLKRRYVGQKAPDLSGLKAVQGLVEELSVTRSGRVTIVEFWATWCAVCQFMAPTLNRWHAEYAPQGVQVVGITMEPVELVARAARQIGMEYPLASDGSGRVSTAYMARVLPTLFVVDTQGVVRDVMTGYSSSGLQRLERLIEQLLAES